MMLVYVLAVILVVGVIIYFVIDSKKIELEPRPLVPVHKDDTLNKKMLKLAQVCVESVLTAFDYQLDYSDASIRILDKVITEGWKGKNISVVSRERVVSTFGAYLGQTFINNYGGIWYEQPPKGSLPIVFVPKANFEFSPAEIIREKYSRMSFFDINIAYDELIKRYTHKLNAIY
jgi:hypothetical protein